MFIIFFAFFGVRGRWPLLPMPAVALCFPETPTLTELAASIDDALFQRIMHNSYHVIHHLLPAQRELAYNIRQRHHDRQLSIISGQLRNRNFIYRTLFKDCY